MLNNFAARLNRPIKGGFFMFAKGRSVIFIALLDARGKRKDAGY